jgi:Domain of unknown function (DUF1918)
MAATTKNTAGTRVGAVIEIHEHRLGEKPRTGEILEVLGGPEHEHYRVRWDDGHESIFYPSGDATIRQAKTAR